MYLLPVKVPHDMLVSIKALAENVAQVSRGLQEPSRIMHGKSGRSVGVVETVVLEKKVFLSPTENPKNLLRLFFALRIISFLRFFLKILPKYTFK